MRIAVISDTHANPPGLEAALADIVRAGAQEVWHLGDVVDWGPDPSRALDLVRQSAAVNLAGNHDLLVAGALEPIDVMYFGPASHASAAYSRSRLDHQELEYLGALVPFHAPTGHDVILAHGSPRDPVWEYVHSPWIAGGVLDSVAQRLVICGHTHRQGVFVDDSPDTDAPRSVAHEIGRPIALEGRRAVLNPGTVGSPREGADHRAQWMLWDTEADTITMHRVAYDLDRLRALIDRCGAPAWFADRLVT